MISRVRSYLLGGGFGAGLVRAVAGSAILNLLGMALTFLVGIQLARGLGVEGYGIYGMAMAVVAILGVPSQFGIPQLVVREVAAHAARKDRAAIYGMLAWSWRTLRCTSLAVFSAFLVWVIAFGFEGSLGQGMTLMLASLLIPLVAAVSLQSAALRGLLHIVKSQIPDALVRPLVTSLLLGGLSIFVVPLNPALAIGVGIASVCVAIIIGWALLFRHAPRRNFPVNAWHSSKGLMRASFAMALGEGLRVVPVHATVIVLGAIASFSDAGQFRVATSIAALLAFPLSIFNMVAAPAMSRLIVTGEIEKLQRLLCYSSAGMFISVLLLSLPFLLMGGYLLEFLFGVGFGEASGMLGILALGTLATAMLGVGGTLLSMAGRQGRVTVITGISVAVLCLFLWPLVKFQGGIGAAWAVTVSMCVSSGLFWHDAKRIVGVDSSVFSCVPAMRKMGKQ